jgi:hypothetical protein
MKPFMTLYFTLYNFRLLDADGYELSQEALKKLWEFYNLLIGSTNSKFIMRVESDRNLRRQFNADTQIPSILAQSLFMTGEKGRICWAEENFWDPDDIRVENFENICGALREYINEAAQGTNNKAKKVNAFCKMYTKFCRAFEDVPSMIEVFKKLSSEEKRRANLYYLALAHTINSPKYRDNSEFVSTTTNPDMAGRFSYDACIYGWVPNKAKGFSHRKTIDIVDINNFSDLEGTGLPFCKIPIFPEQEEIAVRCGLLPHFIIGFAVKSVFYVNPAVFTAIDKMHGLTSFRELSAFKRDIQLYGLEINQENFEEFCKRTNFKRYFTYDERGYKMYSLSQK